MLAFVNLDERVDHPLRFIKQVHDVLSRMSDDFDRNSSIGRACPSTAEVSASHLAVLYAAREPSVRNWTYRWFLDMDLMEPSFDATVFTKNRRRLLRHKVGRTLFEEVAYEADRRGLMSDEHFSVDGTLIEAAASIKSFRRRDDDDDTDNCGNGVSLSRGEAEQRDTPERPIQRRADEEG